MLTCNIKLKIFDPNAPATTITPDVITLGHRFIPHPPDGSPLTATHLDKVTREYLDDPAGGADQPTAAAARRPIRDRVRAGLIRVVAERSPAPVSDDQVDEAITEATSDRPLLDWLANGGLEKLITLVLELLKLAA